MNTLFDDLLKYLKNYYFYLIILILLTIIIIFSVLIYSKPTISNYCEEKETVVNENNEDVKIDNQENTIKVDIKGEVKNPGVYEISDQKIVNDVINMAGGLTKKAETKNINLSKKLKDAMVIYVSSKSETNKNNSSNKTNILNDATIDVNNSEGVVSIQTETNQTNQSEDSTKTLVNINTATLSELMTLAGIGNSKAK